MKLLTFATPFGQFCFKCLPYGILSASEIFQSNIFKIIEGLEGARNSQDDDIAVWGATLAEHNNCVHKVMTKIRESGLKLTKSKCVFGVKSITFLGHKLSSTGISPDPQKFKAISEMPKPTFKTYLQCFLGMVAYLSKFIPNLSDKTKILHELILKDLKETVWDFSKLHEHKSDKLKPTISNCPSLKFFNPKLQTKITCHASKFGLRTKVQWQLETFHEYGYGRKFHIENDHKPLKTIIAKRISEAPPGIQHFIINLQKYDFDVHYIPGKLMILADTLGRATLKDAMQTIPKNETTTYIHSIVHNSLYQTKC